MNSANFDVVVVGAGAAGLSAAISLTRLGFSVVVVEAAAYPGAENWSGCVYFCENLAHPDLLGPEGVEALAWERRLVERGFFATDGYGLLGMTYRDPRAFQHCYTVLRPIYDQHLAHVAGRLGAAILTNTTVETLIRDEGRIIGVCTNRGPLYAKLVYLAEGDASHLVTREGYERFSDARETPKFLQGIKQVIDLEAGAIEEIFGVGPTDGVAYEMLVRNGTLRGKRIQLNMGGFVYTNRQSLSVGLVLPVDNLNEGFGGDPNLLIEWFEKLPALQAWMRRGKPGVFGAKIIRGGGAKDIPTLIDDGLAIGGAASAIGIDFPYPNFTGPATAMGLLIAQASRRIREEGGGFTRDNLRRYYLEPLQKTHYWQDVEFLRRWPGYVKRTQVFFGRNLDLALGTAYVWTRSDRWFLTKWINWLRLALHVGGPRHWHELRQDLRHLVRALRLQEVADVPALGQFLLDGTVNALRDLFGRPRANLPIAGRFQMHYSVAGGEVASGLPPGPLLRWFRRVAPVLAAAAGRVYANDAVPLRDKLPSTFRILVRQVNMLDLMAAGGIAFATALTAVFMAGLDRFIAIFRRGRLSPAPRGLYRRYAQSVERIGDMSALAATAAQNWDARLGQLAYQTVKESHIHVFWPQVLQDKNRIADEGFWHVCPAHVYDVRHGGGGQLQVIVNFENCIKCETCWRSSDLVDWGRDGQQRFIYPVRSPASVKLQAALQESAPLGPVHAEAHTNWPRLPASQAQENDVANFPSATREPWLSEFVLLLQQFEQKLREFEEGLCEEPRTIDKARAEYLEMLARYAQRLAEKIQSKCHDFPGSEDSPLVMQLQKHASDLVNRCQDRARRTWSQKYTWAAAEGRQLRFHHLALVRRLLGVPAATSARPLSITDPWLKAENNAGAAAEFLAEARAKLDQVFSPNSWRELEQRQPLSPEQEDVLLSLLAMVPEIDPAGLAATLHPPIRKAFLAELARRDPSLAYRAASHLWARDMVTLASASTSWTGPLESTVASKSWWCFAPMVAVQGHSGGWTGDSWFVPAMGAQSIVVSLQDHLAVIPAKNANGLRIEALETLGLRGAGIARLRLDGWNLPQSATAVDPDRIRRLWNIISAADLTSIALGMAKYLCKRSIDHATNRVQFPGLFHDESARDTIGKFGAVKKMLAEMEARRLLIETLDHSQAPEDFSAASMERATLIKAVVAEMLGTSFGSLSYNAGQIFGGTGYSEDDTLSKFYRDSAAWRFLGPSNREVFRRHGDELLRNWRADGQRLSAVKDETELFEDLAQRNALQAELDEIRNARSLLKSLVNDWQSTRDYPLPVQTNGTDTSDDGSSATSPRREFESGNGRHPSFAAQAEIAEALARQDGNLLASKALVLRCHARLESGLPAEIDIALVRVWLNYAANALEEFEATVRRNLDPSADRDDHPVVDIGFGPPVASYAEYLAAPAMYESGDFLVNPADLLQPRYIPELLHLDPVLATHDRDIRALLNQQFGSPRGDGIGYERYIEKQHRPDAADLDFCRQHGFFRLTIPRDLGGEGRTKADYYMLIMNAQRLVDVGVSLSIQASTSIGTTPVLLARDKDLPKAQKDLATFLEDSTLHREIRSSLSQLARGADVAPHAAVHDAIDALGKQLSKSVLNRPPVRALVHEFAVLWQEIARRARDFDAAPFRGALEKALTAWNGALASGEDYKAELQRRKEACDLFLRWVASGQISAFALTEPSAGSDTARVATRAVLRSATLEVASDGVYRFIPVGSKEPRFLIDARRLEFRGGAAFYRWSDLAEPAPIQFQEYDYETDDPRCLRYFERQGQRIYFHDVAQLRQRDGKDCYDYWELTGAKMWITNGRICGVMSLYAKTPEGVTGFIVDRHAEGLLVGKDEAKMGQNGSPTNELSLEAVRVPRECVLGVEGRGQVNALETLNVGRAGLAMTSLAQMEGLIGYGRTYARQAYGEIPDWVQWRVDRMEEMRFIAEALGYEVIGRFEHGQTKSVRMESAISKMVVSELLHHVIELTEDIHGLPGQTQLHLVEKRKRDARILNIYEGTNEIQRFSILRDVAGEVAPRWASNSSTSLSHLGRETLELENLKVNFRKRCDASLELFGSDLWQNPNLQANCFLLAEAAAWIKAADSTLCRLAWLTRRELVAGPGEPVSQPGGGTVPDDGCATEEASFLSAQLKLGKRSLDQCFAEGRGRLRRFEEELTHLRRGFYAPEIHAAMLLMSRDPSEGIAQEIEHQVHAPLRILVITETTHTRVPNPEVESGSLLETHLEWTDADQSALEMALRIRDQALAHVHIEVVAVGPRSAARLMRQAINLGADRARLVVTEGAFVSPDSAASAMAVCVAENEDYDLVLWGDEANGGDEGMSGRILAESMGISCLEPCSQLRVQVDSQQSSISVLDREGQQGKSRQLPAGVGIRAGTALRQFGTDGYMQGLSETVELIRWPKTARSRQLTVLPGTLGPQTQAAPEAAGPESPDGAAQLVLKQVGLSVGGMTRTRQVFTSDLERIEEWDLCQGVAAHQGMVLAILAGDSDGRLPPEGLNTLAVGKRVAAALGSNLKLLVVSLEQEENQRRLVGEILESFSGEITILPRPPRLASSDSQSRFLAEAWTQIIGKPWIVLGGLWVEETFIRLASRPGTAGPLLARTRALELGGDQLFGQTQRAGGKLRLRQPLEMVTGQSWWISLASEVEVHGTVDTYQSGAVRVRRLSPRLDRFYSQPDIQILLGELKSQAKVTRLADADFIVDVGFGVGNRDGFEAVIEPLVAALQRIGVQGIVVGGSRKVTEELHLLPIDRQIGQSGVSVNPQILLAIGVSGAPQHLNYIGRRATILAFNRDAEAPIMKLNRTQPRPKVIPIVGDLFETVPAFTAALHAEPAENEVETPASLLSEISISSN
jgi:electron transfer flavoprotein-quinone oxidoreductase